MKVPIRCPRASDILRLSAFSFILSAAGRHTHARLSVCFDFYDRRNIYTFLDNKPLKLISSEWVAVKLLVITRLYWLVLIFLTIYCTSLLYMRNISTPKTEKNLWRISLWNAEKIGPISNPNLSFYCLYLDVWPIWHVIIMGQATRRRGQRVAAINKYNVSLHISLPCGRSTLRSMK